MIYVDIDDAACTSRLAYPNSLICTQCCYLMSPSNLLHLCGEGTGFLTAGKAGGSWGRGRGCFGQEELCCSTGAAVEQTAAGTRALCKAGKRSPEEGPILHEMIV